MNVEHVLCDLGRRVSELRAARGLSQEELAEKVDVSPRYVRAIEAGRQNVTMRTLVRVATALRCRGAWELLVPPLTASGARSRVRKKR